MLSSKPKLIVAVIVHSSVGWQVRSLCHRLSCIQRHMLRHIGLLLFALTCAADLISVQLITRHGNRTPQIQLPKDPIAWLVLGELTGIGMNQHYLLGRALHSKYDGILPLNYSPTDICLFLRCLSCDFGIPPFRHSCI